MRLQSALSMDQFAGLEEEEMGLFRSKEERRAKRKARRAKRKARRKKRRSERRQRKAARLRRRAGRLDSGGGRKRRRRGGGGGGTRRAMRRGGMRRRQRSFEPMLQPAPQWPETEPQWPEADFMPMQPGPEVLEPEVIEPPDLEDFEDALEMEGVGALARRWSPLVKMGRNFRIQAAEGYRAAVVPLKPGLFLVAELPEHVARSEFGIVPLLAPLVVRAASRAISKPPEQRPLYRLFHRQGQGQRQEGQGRPLLQRVFQPRQGQGGGQGQGRTFLQRMFRPRQTAALHEAPPQRSLVPAPGSGQAQNQLLPAPALGAWVDPEDLAGLFDDGQGV